VVFDLEATFVHPPKLQRPKVDVPEPVVNFLEADVFASERVGDADPVLLPANAAVAADRPGATGCTRKAWPRREPCAFLCVM
jgi:hypothetical protein